MRTMGRITCGIAAATLALLLAACGGDDSQTSSSGSTGAATGQSPQAAASLPAKPVCEVFSKKDVSRIIGRTVSTASDVNFMNGAHEPTICEYSDSEDTYSIEIQWMLEKDALWDEQIAGIGATVPGNMKTGRTRYQGLGDDAIREIASFEDTKSVGYMVLLKQRGLVVVVSNTSSVSLVPDAAHLELTKAVIQTAMKL